MATASTPADPDGLLPRFVAAWNACGGHDNPAQAYNRLRWRYATGRVYHGFDHIVAMFNVADELLDEESLDAELTMAIFYHDAIYMPGAKENEQQSAELAVAELGPQADAEATAAIRHLIEATEDHTSDDPRAQLLIDLDLSFLGVDEELFLANVEKLISEFSIVTTRETFLEGQARYLKPFLDREHIFYTEAFRERFEARARSNLRQFIEQQNNE